MDTKIITRISYKGVPMLYPDARSLSPYAIPGRKNDSLPEIEFLNTCRI